MPTQQNVETGPEPQRFPRTPRSHQEREFYERTAKLLRAEMAATEPISDSLESHRVTWEAEQGVETRRYFIHQQLVLPLSTMRFGSKHHAECHLIRELAGLLRAELAAAEPSSDRIIETAAAAPTTHRVTWGQIKESRLTMKRRYSTHQELAKPPTHAK